MNLNQLQYEIEEKVLNKKVVDGTINFFGFLGFYICITIGFLRFWFPISTKSEAYILKAQNIINTEITFVLTTIISFILIILLHNYLFKRVSLSLSYNLEKLLTMIMWCFTIYRVFYIDGSTQEHYLWGLKEYCILLNTNLIVYLLTRIEGFRYVLLEIYPNNSRTGINHYNKDSIIRAYAEVEIKESMSWYFLNCNGDPLIRKKKLDYLKKLSILAENLEERLKLILRYLREPSLDLTLNNFLFNEDLFKITNMYDIPVKYLTMSMNNFYVDYKIIYG